MNGKSPEEVFTVGRVLPIVVAIALLVYALIDCFQTDSARIRSLNRFSWLAIIVLLPVIGPVLWMVLAKSRPHRPPPPPPRRQLAPDDDPEFLKRLGDVEDKHEKMLDQWEADLRKREEEIRQRRDDDDESR